MNKIEIIIVLENALSMRQAAKELNLSFTTFKRTLKKLDLMHMYIPNQAGKGLEKSKVRCKLDEIFEGLHPNYGTHKIKKRLIREGYKEHKCEDCKLTEWQGVLIPLELHHINGNNKDHRLENLQLLCPNCHALTDNYRGKNK